MKNWLTLILADFRNNFTSIDFLSFIFWRGTSFTCKPKYPQEITVYFENNLDQGFDTILLI